MTLREDQVLKRIMFLKLVYSTNFHARFRHFNMKLLALTGILKHCNVCCQCHNKLFFLNYFLAFCSVCVYITLRLTSCNAECNDVISVCVCTVGSFTVWFYCLWATVWSQEVLTASVAAADLVFGCVSLCRAASLCPVVPHKLDICKIMLSHLQE
jgi:hypothetical protein